MKLIAYVRDGADIKNEIGLPRALPYDKKPLPLDRSTETPVFDVTEECHGRRLKTLCRTIIRTARE